MSSASIEKVMGLREPESFFLFLGVSIPSPTNEFVLRLDPLDLSPITPIEIGEAGSF
jgi:hypothetical protein